VKARGQGEDGGGAEEGEGLQHGEDEAAQYGGEDHGQRHGQGHVQAVGPENRRRLFEIGGDELQRVGDHDVHVGEGVDGHTKIRPVMVKMFRSGASAPVRLR